MLKSERARADAAFWTPEMRDEKLRESLPADIPEDAARAIEGGRVKRTLERKTRLLEIEQTL